MGSSPGPTTSVAGSQVSGASTSQPAPRHLRQRLALSGRTPRRLPFERRLRLWLVFLSLPGLLLAALLLARSSSSLPFAGAIVAGLALLYLLLLSVLFDQLTRPLQTLSNVVAALREEDFSFRARGAKRGDALGDLALEINALASTLQGQRSAAMDALTLVELVMASMPSPVLAFDAGGRLKLLNSAAGMAFGLERGQAVGSTAAALRLTGLLSTPDHGFYAPGSEPDALQPDAREPHTESPATAGSRWSVRRATFRLHGVPHALFVLADIAAALREEERQAWQRLIRVLGHEINNSLTPIKSIAGSLRTQLGREHPHPGEQPSFDRGLAIIEDRADSLNRFLGGYGRLSRLPPPVLQPVALASLLRCVVDLETRFPAEILPSPEATLLADPDQLQQLFINLLRNAVDAVLEPDRAGNPLPPRVDLSWSVLPGSAVIQIVDSGPGLTNPANLFVPFYTTKVNGSGIGLLLAQAIASAHGGSLALRNRLDGIGCVAEVRLPLFGPGSPEPSHLPSKRA